ncbi:helix-turn-helix transcriptional regulator [Tengunoibacter tsumagoiensis]|uniref:DNA-binding response regulator n=1 Tax=Tengunoibacter tsumagoiensis TaxID=2014871 RepID=A0A401ZV94_9CHLR|nr:response regulator transcription factor family protein [Tengunoibacter tsumagoiensis]GCE10660.1 hypothetical protein KTT_05190 [Tengunoibacter tsumagoiensis]
MGSSEQLLQILSSMLIEMNALQVQLDAPIGQGDREDNLREGLRSLQEMTRAALTSVRISCADLLPDELEGVALSEALSRLVEESAERLNLASRVAISGADEHGQPEGKTIAKVIERLLFAVSRETLVQVEQHAGARRIRLTLQYGADEILMSLEDDGLNPLLGQHSIEGESEGTQVLPFVQSEGKREELALPSIITDLRYRLEHLGGSLEIRATGEQGTRVQVRMPYLCSFQERAQEPVAIVEAAPSHLVPAMRENVRLLIVESQSVVRAGLQRLLSSYPGLEIVGVAADGLQAVSETLELGPQVVLMDALLPAGQTLEALRQIKQLNLGTRVLLLAVQDREEYLYEALRAGADGYVLKDIEPDELVRAVHAVARGELQLQPQMAGRLISRLGRQGRYETLTNRELEVLQLLARGLRNKEIAARLFVSERTVNFHLANIYQKLEVSGRTEALSKALEQGLIPRP